MTKTSLESFFASHPVFTVEEADQFLNARVKCGTANPATRQALLTYYRKQGRLQPIRQGLYVVAPASREQGTELAVDSFLIASRLTPDAVLAYHSALEQHGLAHSLREERVILSQQKFVRPLQFAGVHYRAVLPPSALPQNARMTLGVEERDRQGLPLRLTGIERTLIDILDRPVLSGGWEEAWRAWENVDLALDFPLLLKYVSLLGNATTAAKLGYALEEAQERLAVQSSVLDRLHHLAPHQPHPVERGRRAGTRLVQSWNLLIPTTDSGEVAGEMEEDWGEVDGNLAHENNGNQDRQERHR